MAEMESLSLESLDRASTLANQMVGAITDEQFSWPTPCSEWNVRNVLNHILLGDLILIAVINQLPPPDRSVDHLGDDPRAAVRQGLADFRALIGEPGMLERQFTAARGQLARTDLTGTYFLEHRVADLTAHLWDLARATGQPTDFDPELNEAVLAHYVGRLAGADRANMPVADAQPVPENATAADRLAAYLGRHLDFAPAV
jgi:uncharacterized protein (TIGR03086 family)